MYDPKISAAIDPGRFRAVFLLLLVTGITFIFISMIRSFLIALLLGAIFSGLAQPAYRRVLGWVRGRRSLASGITLLLFVFVLLVPAAVFLGIVANQAVQVSESVGPWIADIQRQIDEPGGVNRLIEQLPFSDTLRPYQEQIAQKLGELAGSIGEFVVRHVAGITRGTVTFIFLLFVMLYAMFFFLKDGGRILQKILYYLPLSSRDENRMLERFLSVSRAVVKGTFLIGIVQGGLSGLSFVVVGLPAAAFWGTVMVVLSIIPGIGAALVWVPAGVYLLVNGHIGAGIGLILWNALVVGTVDNLMRPWLVGRDTQMPDLLILLGTLGGIVLFGAAGVIIGPIVAALFVTVWELYGEAFRSILPEAELPDVVRNEPVEES